VGTVIVCDARAETLQAFGIVLAKMGGVNVERLSCQIELLSSGRQQRLSLESGCGNRLVRTSLPVVVATKILCVSYVHPAL